MRRREFIAGFSSAAALPLAARAQERVRRVGVLMHSAADEPEAQARFAAFLQGLQEAGWAVGRNVRIDTRWSVGDNARLSRDAVELVALGPDVILAGVGGTTGALQRASRTVPIVFAQSVDPVGNSFVESLGRPGGNTTGFIQLEYSLSGKWLELLKQIAPNVTNAAILWDPTILAGVGQFAVIQSVAPSLGVEVRAINVRDAAEIERGVGVLRVLVVGRPPLLRDGAPALLRRRLRHGVRRDRAGDGIVAYGPAAGGGECEDGGDGEERRAHGGP